MRAQSQSRKRIGVEMGIGMAFSKINGAADFELFSNQENVIKEEVGLREKICQR